MTIADFRTFREMLNDAFEGKVEERITNYADKILHKNKLPSFSELQNIHKTAYDDVLNNPKFGGSLRGYFADDISSLVNNSLSLGLVAAKNNPDKNSPEAQANKPGAKSAENVSDVGMLQYPVPGEDTNEIAPYMVISGFKYQYDTTDVLGNKRARLGKTPAEGESAPKVSKTAIVKLPLPGNLASGLSQNFEDYSSVFAKLVKANNGNAGDGQNIQDQLGGLMDQATSGSYKDITAIATMAGLFGFASGGLAGGVTAALDESLKYIRVAGGFTVNPMQQTSYIGANMRTHSFEFNMVPKNRIEAMECKKIIETLQYCSIGEKRTELGGILINFPSVWNISFYNYNNKLINGMLEIPDSFLAEVNVTYSPSRAGFTVTRDNDPFAYVLNLTFRECQNLVRDDLSYLRQGGTLLAGTYPVTPEEKFKDLKTDVGIAPDANAESTGDDPNATPNAAKVKVNSEATAKQDKTSEFSNGKPGSSQTQLEIAGIKGKNSPEVDAAARARDDAYRKANGIPIPNRTGDLHVNKLEVLGQKAKEPSGHSPDKPYNNPKLKGRK